MTSDFPLTRADALARWRAFQPRLTRYGAARNFVGERHEAVSRLSPALRLGLLTPEQVVRETLERHALNRVEKWVQEVCWRSYWKGWLEMRPQVWRAWRRRLRELENALPESVRARAEEVAQGRSGVAVMDRFARELRATGYLHNHARMWWASFWIHVERLPWELGAAFFFRHLLDADPASNTLSWRWVAGLQTPGKTYLVRRSNLERYAESLLEDRTGLERLEDGTVTPVVASEHADLTRHPLADWPCQCPALPTRTGLWLHADDLTAEDSPLAALRPVAVAAFSSTASYVRYGLSARRQEALRTALRDGVTRAATHFGVEATCKDAPTTAEGLREWAIQERLEAVVALAPSVGPVADALPGIERTLGVPLHLVRRPWEAQLYPWARAGFFPFWEKTSRWLASAFAPVTEVGS